MRTVKLPDGTIKPHPWRRVQTQWAFPAWRERNPVEAAMVNERFEKENRNYEHKSKERKGK